jgi:hypothetical protein
VRNTSYFTLQTPTRFGSPASKAVTKDNNFLTTIAGAYPLCPSGLAMLEGNKQAPEALACRINK